MQCNPLGYEHNDGGINNQKLALLGLFVAANQGDTAQGRRVYLPNIYNKHQHDAYSTREDFGSVFWLDIFEAFAARWEIELVERPASFSDDRLERNGWHYFGQGAGHIAQLAENNRDAVNTDIAADFFRSLVPKVKSTAVFQAICDQIFYKNNINAAIQLRIEEDWCNYSRDHLGAVVKHAEDYWLSAEEIIKKVKNTLPDVGNKVYVSCDERYIFQPKWDIRESVLKETDIEIIFKSDLMPLETFDSIPQVDASLIDFEIGKIANVFVGLSRSTFANLVCFERYVCFYKAHQNDYVYNKLGPLLGRRTDLGTKDDPWAATA